MRWDLVDQFTVIKKGRFSRAFKNFTGKEDFFADHFSSQPEVPGTLLVEMMAQAGGILFGVEIDFKKEVILAKISEVCFPRVALPPCRLDIETHLEQQSELGAWIRGTVKHADETVAQAEIFLVTMDFLGDKQDQSVVFGEKFFKHYNIKEILRMSEVAA